MLELDSIKTFRNNTYLNIGARRDASMNLLDSLSSYGQHCKRVIELSEAPCFERQYSSVTDAIADGLMKTDWQAMEKLIYQQAKCGDRVVFIPDCTANIRPFSGSLEDRHITYYPNPAPGNKPIGVGHQYSVVGLQPVCHESAKLHWLLPLSVKRVSSGEKGNEVGMQQISETIHALGLSDKRVISIADSLYSTVPCREYVSRHNNWVHICRLNSKRNLHVLDSANGARRYGHKMQLNRPDSFPPSQSEINFTSTAPSGKSLHVTITTWHDMVIRGSRTFKGDRHPMMLHRVKVVDETGKNYYKRPLWLLVTGEHRHEILAKEVYDYYVSRYDIEHYFRFGKGKLLMNKYQTPSVKHEECWWKLCSLAYTQLFLARQVVRKLPRPWEKYLASYQDDSSKKSIATPCQAQRDFAYVLDNIGTPALTCRSRGNPKGRKQGETQEKRERYPIKFKSNQEKKRKNPVISASEKPVKNSDPQTIEQLLENVVAQLGKLDCSAEKFSSLLQNTC